MAGLYHLVPDNLSGWIHYPLYELNDHIPRLYTAHRRKYEGRETLLERRIPFLECIWNDVLHLSPVHPARIRKALVQAGFNTQPQKWFENPVAQAGFNPDNSVIYLHPGREKGNFSISKADFERFDQAKLAGITEVPKATRKYFQMASAKGERPFLFNFIPHILSKGNLPISILG